VLRDEIPARDQPEALGAHGGVGGKGRAARPAALRAVAVGHRTDLAIDLVAHPAAEAMSGEHRVLLLGGCPSSHGGCGERSGGCERRARSSLLRRAFRHASSVVAALAALAPRLVRLAHHDYSDRLLIWNDLSNVLVTFPFLSLWSGTGGGRGGRSHG